MKIKTDNYEIYKGDCLELMKDIPDNSVDMILCDLPYATTKNQWDTLIPFEPLWKQYERVIKQSGAIVLFAQTPFDKFLGSSNPKLLRYEWIWEKPQGTGFLNAKKMPLKNHENILVFYKKLPIYHPQMEGDEIRKVKRNPTHKKTSNYGAFEYEEVSLYKGRYPKSVLKFKHDKQKFHPTQKPVELLEYLIKTYTNEREIVLDNCMGSGSTGVACINTNRKFIGIELDDKYFEISKSRLNEAAEKKEELLKVFDKSN